MSLLDEIQVNQELSEEFRAFEEFCGENTGSELVYFGVVKKDPLAMDPVTLAFTMQNLVRLSRELMDQIIPTLNDEAQITLGEILSSKGIQLDKKLAQDLRLVLFAFRDEEDESIAVNMVRAFQLMTIGRERKRVVFNFGESYAPPDEGWTAEDFAGDDTMFEAVRSVEDPRWNHDEEM